MDAQTLDKYRLLRCIGVGGMAEVYEARRADDPTTDERVAVKVLLPQHAHELDIVKSFIDEATIAAGLSHPNVVGVLDWGCADDQYFIVMERVDGWDLQQLIARSAALGRQLPAPAAAYVIHELARALDYIHTRPFEIVHRDVTPHNVFVDRAGRVKLSDFGVAKTAARWSQTHTGLIKGKLGYLAPEQVRGEPVSPRTDIYCAGLVLYELLTCQRYNRTSSQSGLLARAHDPVIQLPSQVNAEAAPLDAVIRGALQHDSALRTRDAALLAEQTGAVLQQHPFTAAELAELATQLEHATAQTQTQPDAEQSSTERRRPQPQPQRIEWAASGELLIEETDQTLPSGPPEGIGETFDAQGGGLAPEEMLGAPEQHELLPEETVRTSGPQPPGPAPAEEPATAPGEPEALAPSETPPARRALPVELVITTDLSKAAAQGQAATRDHAGGALSPGDPESGLYRLLNAPPDQPLKATPTRSDDLLVPPAARRPRRILARGRHRRGRARGGGGGVPADELIRVLESTADGADAHRGHADHREARREAGPPRPPAGAQGPAGA